MTPLYLITLGGFSVSGRELAIVAVAVIVVLGVAWYAVSRGRRGV